MSYPHRSANCTPFDGSLLTNIGISQMWRNHMPFAVPSFNRSACFVAKNRLVCRLTSSLTMIAWCLEKRDRMDCSACSKRSSTTCGGVSQSPCIPGGGACPRARPGCACCGGRVGSSKAPPSLSAHHQSTCSGTDALARSFGMRDRVALNLTIRKLQPDTGIPPIRWISSVLRRLIVFSKPCQRCSNRLIGVERIANRPAWSSRPSAESQPARPDCPARPRRRGTSVSPCQAEGAIGLAPRARRPALSGPSKVKRGLPHVMILRQSASILPPALA